MSHADLVMDSGRRLADLGETRPAQRLTPQGTAALPAIRSKTRAVFLAHEAENYLRAGDPEHTAAAVTASLTLGQSIDASRCIRMVRNLEPRFARHADVHELLENPPQRVSTTGVPPSTRQTMERPVRKFGGRGDYRLHRADLTVACAVR